VNHFFYTKLTSNAELLSLSMIMNSGFRVKGYRSPGCKLNTHVKHVTITAAAQTNRSHQLCSEVSEFYVLLNIGDESPCI